MELSNRLKVKPLKEGEVKIFKLVNSGKIDPVTGKASVNSGGSFVGHFTIYDRFEENASLRRKTLKNVVTTETRIDDKGKEYVKEIIANIEFNSNGLCIVKPEEYNKLVVMTRANENLSNKYRNPSVPAIWEESEPTPSILKLIEQLDIKYEAATFARNGDINFVKAVVAKLLPGSKLKEVSEIRYSARQLAEEKPLELLRHSNNKEIKLRVLTKECYDYKIIDFIDESLEWHLTDDNTKDSLIYKCEIGKDPESDFIEFLKKNSGVTKKITELLNAALHETMEVLV